MSEEQKTEAAQPQYWAVIPAEVRYDTNIPAGAKLLYAEISSLTDRRGYCFASNAYFQKLYSISEPTVQRYLKALRERGYIVIADGGGGSGRRKIYAGINPLAGNPIKNEGVPGNPLKNEGVPDNPLKNEGVTPSKMRPITRKITGNTIPPNPPKGGGRVKKAKDHCDWEPELFEAFWKLYPRAEDKAAARYEWDELRPDPKLMREMSSALKRQIASDEWRRGVGIPYACRWLSKRRWEGAEKLLDKLEKHEDERREEIEWLN